MVLLTRNKQSKTKRKNKKMATNKKNIKVRDLKPKKDAKGGAGALNGGTTKRKTGAVTGTQPTGPLPPS